MRRYASPTRIIRRAIAGGALIAAAAILGHGAPPLAPGADLLAPAALLSPSAALAQTPPPSTDADLSGVAFADVGGGTSGIALTATFAAATTSYDVGVSPDVQPGGITISPTVNHASARFAFREGSAAHADANTRVDGHQANVGTTLIVRVTAEDGSTTKDYTFNILRDYDDDDDGYIDVRNRAQLDAMRYDLNTDGTVDSQTNAASHTTPFPRLLSGSGGARFGCPTTGGCVGYELRADIDLSGSAWTPLGSFLTRFTGKFKGNGHIISGLNDGSGNDSNSFGLFDGVGSTGEVEGFGLTGVTITNAGAGGGAAVGYLGGTLRNVYAKGSITGSTYVGGLVGSVESGGTVRAAYANVSVTSQGDNQYGAGALAGENASGGTIEASYAIGAVARASAPSGGLVGSGSGTITVSYHDVTATGIGTALAGTGQATTALQGPTSYTVPASNPYSTWNTYDIDGDSNADDAWDFGTASQYPVLKAGGHAAASQRPGALASIAFTDNDGNAISPAPTLNPAFSADVTSYTLSVTPAVADGQVTFAPVTRNFSAAATIAYYSGSPLATLADANTNTGKDGHQVNVGVDAVVRVTEGSATKDYTFSVKYDYDDDNDGYIDVRTREQLEALSGDLNTNGDQSSVPTAFANPLSGTTGARFGCPATGCIGYELRADIDLSGTDWTRLGNITGRLRGNGHTISNMKGSGFSSELIQARDSGNNVIPGTGVIEGIGFLNVDVDGHDSLGGIASFTRVGTVIRNVYVTGTLDAHTNAGGVVGWNQGRVLAAWSSVAVTGGTNRTGQVVGYQDHSGSLINSLAMGTGGEGITGLANGDVLNAYHDQTVSGIGTAGTWTARTTSALQTPSDYGTTGIYENWDDRNVDGVAGSDDAWDFGTNAQYPVLKAGGHDPQDQFDLQIAELSGENPIVISAGSTAANSVTGTGTVLTLSPTFAAGTTSYTTTASTGATHITVAPTAAAGAKIEHLDALDAMQTDADSNAEGHQILLSTTGATEFKIKVTAPNGVATRTYSFTVSMPTDYDGDDDGLIDIRNRAQLDAMRYDLNTDGTVDSSTNATSFATAFPNQLPGTGAAAMGCSHDHDGDSNTPNQVACTGYELLDDLDLSTDGNWTPIGTSSAAFTGKFVGGHVISNMTVSGATGANDLGLFGVLAGTAEKVWLVNASVTGDGSRAGALAGTATSAARITSSFSTGSVNLTGSASTRAGGLVGRLEKHMTSTARGFIGASYSTATVDAVRRVGGLVGDNDGTIRASYALGEATAGAACDGALVGQTTLTTPTQESWSLGNNAWRGCPLVGAYTGARNLLYESAVSFTPEASVVDPALTAYGSTGVYAGWNDWDPTDPAAASSADAHDPWDFVDSVSYPILKEGFTADEQTRQKRMLNRKLSGLALSYTGSDQTIAISPAFSATTSAYTATIREGGNRYVTVTPTVAENSGSAKVSFGGSDAANGQVTLNTGQQSSFTVTVVVSAPLSNVPTRTITITITSVTTGVPIAPRNLAATRQATQMDLSWDADSDTTIDKYQVCYQATTSPGVANPCTTSVGTWNDVASSSHTTTSASITGLTAETEYTFSVRSVDTEPTPDANGAISSVTRSTRANAPEFPSETVTARFTVGKANLADFRVPAATGGSGTITYAVTGTALPEGLVYTPPTSEDNHGGTINARDENTLTAGGPTDYVIIATDSASNTDTITIRITIEANETPEFTVRNTDLHNASQRQTAHYILGKAFEWDIPVRMFGNQPHTATGGLAGSFNLPSGFGVEVVTDPDTGDATAVRISGSTRRQTHHHSIVTLTDRDGDSTRAYVIFDEDKATDPEGGDTAPSFTATHPAQTYTHNHAYGANDVVAVPGATNGQRPLVYSATGLPSGMTFDPVSRKITGTPTMVGNGTATITAKDTDKDTGTLTFNWRVAADTTPAYVAPNNAGSRTYVLGYGLVEDYQFQVPPPTGGNPPYTYQDVGTPTLQSFGLSLDANTGKVGGTLVGRPTNTPGSSEHKIQATDQNGDVTPTTARYTLTITREDDSRVWFSQSIALGEESRVAGSPIPPINLDARDTDPRRQGNGPAIYSVDFPSELTGLMFEQGVNAEGVEFRRILGTPSYSFSDNPRETEKLFTLWYRVRDSDTNNAAGDGDAVSFDLNLFRDLQPAWTGVSPPNQIFTEGQTNISVTLPQLPAGQRGNANPAPTFYADPNTLVADPDLTYSIVGTLPGGLTYNAPTSQAPAGTLTAATLADVDADETTNLALRATDFDGDYVDLAFTFEVENDRTPVFPASAPDAVFTSGKANRAEEVYEVPAATGGNGTLTYAAGTLPGSLTYNAPGQGDNHGGTITGTTTAAGSVVITVSDADSPADTDTITINITVVSDADGPEFLSSVAPQTYVAGHEHTALELPAAHLTMPGNPPVEYALSTSLPGGALPTGMSYTKSTRILATSSSTQATTNPVTFTYTATDRDGDTNATALTFTVTIEPNATPSYTGAQPPNRTLRVGKAVSFSVAPNQGNAPFTCAIKTGTLPATSLALRNTPTPCTITGTPVAGDVSNTAFSGTVEATDADGQTATSAQFTIAIALNQTPSFTPATATAYFLRNTPGSYQVPIVSTVGDGTMTYARHGTVTPPAGLTYYAPGERDAANNVVTGGGQVSGTATAAVGSTDIIIRASDSDPTPDTADLTLTITIEEDSSPVIVAPDYETNNANGRPLSIQLPAATSNNAHPLNGTITYTHSVNVVGGRGLAYAAPTAMQNHGGIISGTPNANGAVAFTVTATDRDGSSGSVIISLNIVADSEPSYATPNAIADRDFPRNIALSSDGVSIAPSGGNAPVTCAITSGTLPAGLALKGTNNDECALVGTPTTLTTAPVSITVRATDNDGQMATDTFTIEVSNSVPTFNPNMVTAEFSQGVARLVDYPVPAAEGGDGTITYALDSTTPLPANLTYNAPTSMAPGGTITGIAATVGSTDVTITATDENMDAGSLTLTISVVANKSPSFASPSGSVTFTAGKRNLTAFQLPVVSGGNGDLTWDYSALPADFVHTDGDADTRGTVNAAPSNSLTASAATDYAIIVRDRDGDSATFTLSVTIVADAIPSWGSTPQPAYFFTKGRTFNRTLPAVPATTQGNGSLTYSLLVDSTYTALPTGVTLASDFATSRKLTSAVATGEQGGTTTHAIRATDADGSTADLQFTIQVATNSIPTFPGNDASGNATFTIGKANTADNDYTVPEATDGNTPITYAVDTAKPLPNGLNFNPTTRVISAAPSNTLLTTQSGAYDIIATDRDDETATHTVTITIERNQSNVTITAPTYHTDHAEDRPITLTGRIQMPVASGGNAPYAYTATFSPSTSGFEFKAPGEMDAQNNEITGGGIIVGTPAAAHRGAVTATITATDRDGDTGSVNLNLNIVANGSPSYTGAAALSNQTFSTGKPVSFSVAPGGDGNAPVTCALASGSLPTPTPTPDDPGLTLSGCTVSGTAPSAASTRGLAVTATDLDGQTATSASFNLVIETNTVPSWGASPMGSETFTIGSHNVLPFKLPAVRDGNGTLTYTDTLPDGITLSEPDFGETQYTVNADADNTLTVADSGPYNIVVTDRDGDSHTYVLSVTIENDFSPSWASNSGSVTFSEGRGNTDAFPLPIASGGNGDITFDATALPSSLTFMAQTETGSPPTTTPGTVNAKTGSGNTLTASVTPTTYNIIVFDRDGDTSIYRLAVTIEANTAPAFASTMGSATFTRGKAASFELPVVNNGNGTLAYDGSAIDAVTGLTYTAPGQSDNHGGTVSAAGNMLAVAGATDYAVTVTDRDGESSTFTLRLTVEGDANLSAVAFTDNTGADLVPTSHLSPAFDAATTSYTVGVSPDTPGGEVTITPTTSDPTASVSYREGSALHTDDNGDVVGRQAEVGTDLIVRVSVGSMPNVTTKDYTFSILYDYDDDDDGYIDVRTPGQLAAISGDLDTNGNQDPVPGAFTHPLPAVNDAADCRRFGAPNAACVGYELRADIDLDGSWTRLGTLSGRVRGNGHTISNLGGAGFAHSLSGVIEGIGFLNVNVSGGSDTGAVAGNNYNAGVIRNVYVTGTVSATTDAAGGVVGFNSGAVTAVWTSATVNATGQNPNLNRFGAVIGRHNQGTLATSYSVGPNRRLVGESSGGVSASYHDADVSGVGTAGTGTAKTTSDLQSPTDYGSTANDIYMAWDEQDVDGDSNNDDAWDFGTMTQYPALKAGGHDPEAQFLLFTGGLKSLEIRYGSTPLPLIRAGGTGLHPAATDYKIIKPSGATQVTVIATVPAGADPPAFQTEAGATLADASASADDFQVTLNPTGATTFKIVATAAIGSASRTYTFVINDDSSPTYTPDSRSVTWTRNRPVDYDASATGGELVSYDDTTELPDGLSVNPSTGKITGTPTATGTGPFTAVITATDNDGTPDDATDDDVDTLTLTITLEANSTPVFAPSQGSATFTLGRENVWEVTSFRTAIPAVTSNNANQLNTPITYTDNDTLPPGLRIVLDNNVRYIRGAPISAQNTAGEVEATITATDSDGEETTYTLNITLEADREPECGQNANEPITVDILSDAMIRYIHPVTEFGNQPLVEAGVFPRWHVATNVPTGLQLLHVKDGDVTTAFGIRGSASAASGTVGLNWIDRDNAEIGAANCQITFNLVDAANNTQPSFASATQPTLTFVQNHEISDPVELQAMATGGQGPLHYTAANLPAGLALDFHTRKISGTPTTVTAGQTVTLTATDTDSDAVSTTFTIVIEQDSQPQWGTTAQPNQTVTERRELSATLPALPAGTAGNSPVTYDVDTTSVPWLTYRAPTAMENHGGTLSGRAPVNSTAGDIEHNLSLVATDANDDDASLAFTVTVQNDTSAPSFSPANTGAATYTIGRANLAFAQFQVPEVTGGNAPIQYAISGQPSGLTLDSTTRRITGTPLSSLSEGDVDATITATDANSVTANFTLTVTLETDRGPDCGLQRNVGLPVTILRGADIKFVFPVVEFGNQPLLEDATWPNLYTGFSPIAGLELLHEKDEATGFTTALGIMGNTSTTSSSVPSGSLTWKDRDDTGINANDCQIALTFTSTDTQPDFGSASQSTLTFVNGEEIAAVTLPAATGGQGPLHYTASNLPDGLALNFHTRELTGTPTTNTPNAGARVTLTARDTDSDADTMQFTINVVGGVTVDATSLSITEGDGATPVTGTYRVRLASQPSGTVRVTPSVDPDSCDNCGVSLASTSALRFTTTNWSTYQTVTVNVASDDGDSDDESATITHDVSGANYDGVPAPSIEVSVMDNDSPGVRILNASGSPITSFTLDEGATTNNTYQVQLNTLPTSNVTVTLASDNTDVEFSPLTLTFRPAGPQSGDPAGATKWDDPQTITITARQDGDVANDSATITHTTDVGSGGDANYASAAGISVGLAVTVTDDDFIGLVSTPTALTILESDSGTPITDTYALRLGSQPTHDVVVTPSGTGLTITGGSGTNNNEFTFTSANWSATQDVTVRVNDDTDTQTNTRTITHAAASTDGNYNTTFGTASNTQHGVVTVTATDDDTPGITTAPATTLAVPENGSANYTVVLNTRPSGNVTVAISKATGDSPDITFAGGVTSLAFTTSNWNSAQTVTVNAADDADAQTDTATITHTSSGGGYTSAPAVDLAVTVTENDADGVDVSDPSGASPTLAVTEGASATYTVKLTAQPSATVTVTPSVPQNSPITISPNSATLNTSNWSTGRTFTVSAARDDDGDDETETITHGASGGGYGATEPRESLDVTVTDSNPPGVRILNASNSAITSLTVAEGATTNNTYRVRLNSQPSSDVTVALASNNADVSVPASLTFTMANWSSAQTVTITAGQDGDADNDSATITHTTSVGAGGDAGYAASEGISVDLAVTVTDDDFIGIVSDPIALTITEESGSGTYTLRLGSQPTHPVTVTPSGGNRIEISGGTGANNNQFAFTASNWATPKTVTVGVGDDTNTQTETLSITHAASSTDGDYNTTFATASNTQHGVVTVTARDNDVPGITTQAGTTPFGDITTLAVPENGNASYRVVLNTEPIGDVTVTLRSNNSEVTLSGSSLTNNRLTFTTTNWSTAQTVTVNAADDDDAQTDTATISHTPSGGGYSSTDPDHDADLAVTVTENDADGVDVSDPSGANPTLAVTEGMSSTYRVVLTAQPISPVTVTPSFPQGQPIRISPNSVTLTRSNWSTGRTFTVSATEDGGSINERVTVTHGASSQEGYDGTEPREDLIVQVTDNDAPGLIYTSTRGRSLATLALTEGQDGAYRIRLATAPVGNVTVTPSGTGVTISGGSQTNPNQFTFTPSNYRTTQTVTVTPADDGDTNDVSSGSIGHTLSSDGSNDPYHNLAGQALAFTVADDDFVGLRAAPAAISVTEEATTGDGRTYALSLGSQPSASVTVTPQCTAAAPACANLSFSPPSLTFRAGDWDTGKTVTVSVEADDNAVNERQTITHVTGASTDPDYANKSGADANFADAQVVVTALDDDVPQITEVVFDDTPSGADAGNPNTWVAGERFAVVVRFSRDVTVTGTPQLALRIGNVTRSVPYFRTHGGTRLRFLYTVQTDDIDDSNGLSIPRNALTLPSGARITHSVSTNVNANRNHDAVADDSTQLVDGRLTPPPVVESVSFGELPSAGSWGFGENLVVRVYFNLPVEITGSPRLKVNIGGVEREAVYSPEDTATARVPAFKHVVQATDVDTDGVAAPSNAIVLSAGDGVAHALAPEVTANLAHSAVMNVVGSPTPRVDGTTSNLASLTLATTGGGSVTLPLMPPLNSTDASAHPRRGGERRRGRNRHGVARIRRDDRLLRRGVRQRAPGASTSGSGRTDSTSP